MEDLFIHDLKECPLLAISGPSAGPLISVRFAPESRHLERGRYTSASDPKRTFNGISKLAGGDRKPVASVPDHSAVPPADGRRLGRRYR